MTKTTNFEISKKLEEIGFSRQAFWVWTSKGCCCPFETYLDGFRAYDLETLLEFAFNNIENFRICDRGVSVAEFLSDYDNWHGHYKIVDNLDISIGFKETKISYANAIGQLIILLHEKKLIKF